MSRRQFGRIRKLPSGRWQARYPDGLGRDIPAPSTFATKADASAYLARVQTEMERGVWLDPSLGRTTFAEWAREWMTANPAKRATTVARDKVVLETHFIPTLGDRSLAKITPAHIKGCVDAMVARLAPATVRTNVGVLKAVFNAAIDAELIARSPARAIRVTGGMAPERPTLNLGHLDRLAKVVSGNYRVLILVAGVLGLRWSECAGLQIGDVDFLRRTLTVRRTIAEVEGRFHTADTKSRASRRTLTVPAFLIEELARHIAAYRPYAGKDDLVFTSPQGGPLRRYFQERVFKPAVTKAGVAENLTFHGLRHVAASLMVEQGEHPRVIQARLGHATARLSMELYAHVPESADRNVAVHLDASWNEAHANAAGTIGHVAGTSTPTKARHEGLRRPNPRSQAVEVMGLEPTTSTLRT